MKREAVVVRQAHVRKLAELGQAVATPAELESTLVHLVRGMPEQWREAAGGRPGLTDVQVAVLGPEDSLEGPYYTLEGRAFLETDDLPPGCEFHARYVLGDIRVAGPVAGL